MAKKEQRENLNQMLYGGRSAPLKYCQLCGERFTGINGKICQPCKTRSARDAERNRELTRKRREIEERRELERIEKELSGY